MTLEELAARLPALPAHVLAGVSGGADSVALLRTVLLVPGVRVSAVHVNHGLRGAASDGDEAFVRALCETLNVPIVTYHAVPPADPGEDWARQARYGFFREAMAHTGADALLLAHHRDDQAETLLLHLLRGAGLNGLGGMSADAWLNGMRVMRPLLNCTRDELREALAAAGQTWREDASNADPRYLRNAVRGELLPLMERLTPGASGRIAAAAGLLRGYSEALAAQTECFLAAHAGDDWLTIAPVLELHPALRADVLRAWWQSRAGSGMDEHALSLSQTEALCGLLDAAAGAKCNLPGRWQGQRGWHCLHLVSPMRMAAPAPVPATNGAQLCGVALRVLPGCEAHGDGRITQAVPADFLDGCVLRTRQPGDWLRPFGSSGKQSLQDFFTNKRVDAPFRDRVPLLCRGSEVLLVAGVGAGAVPDASALQETVSLIWKGDMPWMI